MSAFFWERTTPIKGPLAFVEARISRHDLFSSSCCGCTDLDTTWFRHMRSVKAEILAMPVISGPIFWTSRCFWIIEKQKDTEHNVRESRTRTYTHIYQRTQNTSKKDDPYNGTVVIVQLEGIPCIRPLVAVVREAQDSGYNTFSFLLLKTERILFCC